VATPVAESAELHAHIMDGDVARMRPVEAIEVSPGEPTVLEPGGFHVMLMGLKQPLNEGEVFPLTLTFEKAGEVTMEVPIRGLKGEMKQGEGHQHQHGS
jgi:copper(I)-binding protein